MDHRKNSKRHWNNKRFGDKKEKNQLTEEEQKSAEAIKNFKQNTPECPKCHQPVTELATALADKKTGEPMHFDCVLDFIKKTEKIGPNERLTYIGQGRFGILYFENPHDLRHFTIKKVIEWENKETTPEWRLELTQIHSQT